MQKEPVTLKGAERLREELHRMKFVDRPRIVKAIATARAHGDLKENAEYHAAKEQQGFLEGRIQEIDSRLSHAQIIDIASLDPGDKVVFGAKVNLINEENGEKVTYQVVGDLEADISKGLLSINSPVARALIGKEVGEIATVNAPAGEIEYEIDSVSYDD
ncbi:transcription elongation factor GreA [Gammaproteobacteria bacterium AH-315-C21]|nr:transcription elongation factor GreA [Gammaproteobacteria bacterium AH-315-C21]